MKIMDSCSAPVEAFLSFLREAEQRYHMAEADEQEANDVTQDILHSLELEPHEAEELQGLALELAAVRRKRREAKDRIAMSAPVLAWLEENRPVVKGLERLLGEARKAERRTEGRIYTPRVKK